MSTWPIVLALVAGSLIISFSIDDVAKHLKEIAQLLKDLKGAVKR
jgi:hypothetical protein